MQHPLLPNQLRNSFIMVDREQGAGEQAGIGDEQGSGYSKCSSESVWELWTGRPGEWECGEV